MSVPASVPADGNLMALFVPALADPANPTVGELQGGTVVDLSCYLTSDGLQPGGDEQNVPDPRLCTRQDFERPGRFTDTLELRYIYRPQEPASPTNKAYSTLVQSVQGYVVTRWGLPYETAIAATQIVDVYPVQAGVQRKQPPEANSVFRVNQKMFVTGVVERDQAVAA